MGRVVISVPLGVAFIMAMRYGVPSEATPSVKLLTTGIEGSESGAGMGAGLRGDFLPETSSKRSR